MEAEALTNVCNAAQYQVDTGAHQQEAVSAQIKKLQPPFICHF